MPLLTSAAVLRQLVRSTLSVSPVVDVCGVSVVPAHALPPVGVTTRLSATRDDDDSKCVTFSFTELIVEPAGIWSVAGIGHDDGEKPDSVTVCVELFEIDAVAYFPS